LSSRHYVGRHRPAHAAVDSKIRRAPKSLSAGFVLPTAAAAALVVTATGATMAEASGTAAAAPRAAIGAFGVAPQVSQQLKAQSEEAQANASGVDDRRAAATSAEAALAGRQQESQRAARTRARVLAKAKAAAAVAAEKQAKAEAAARAHDWVMPVNGASFTSGFKFRWGRMHTGNDLACAEGTPIVAMSTGEVVFAGWMGGGGNTTKIRYWDGTVSFYEHQSAILVNVGDTVAPGDLVGRVGNTGHSFGAHLHLEIHPAGGGPIDPHPWMQEHGLSY
jgi:murein DD-endopeptidase MepM/ murein hydrolase activator NlpD